MPRYRDVDVVVVYGSELFSVVRLRFHTRNHQTNTRTSTNTYGDCIVNTYRLGVGIPWSDNVVCMLYELGSTIPKLVHTANNPLGGVGRPARLADNHSHKNVLNDDNDDNELQTNEQNAITESRFSSIALVVAPTNTQSTYMLCLPRVDDNTQTHTH